MDFKDYVPTRVLHDFVERIEKLGINYMLTGSMAMIRYTVFRQTANIDIFLELNFRTKKTLSARLNPTMTFRIKR